MRLPVGTFAILATLATFLWTVDGYRYLGVFPFHAKSHFMMFEGLMKGLASKGHRVDVISPFPLKTPHPNYTDLIVLKPSGPQLMNNLSYEMVLEFGTDTPRTVATMAGNDVCRHVLPDPRVLKLVRNPPKDSPYDLVFIEIFGAHCFAIIGHQWNVPVVGVSSSVLYAWAQRIIANPPNLAFVANNLLNYPRGMNFWERAYNTLHAHWQMRLFDRSSEPQTDIVREHFGPDAPDIRRLEESVAMILTNSHMTIDGIKPSTPALVEVGGLHVRDDGPEIPQELIKWLDEGEQGFVYFSFGSMVKVESFPRQFLDVFLKCLGKISPVRVLMKVASPEELPAGLPSNIRTYKWLPQLKILRHPKARAFITHSGLMGTQEAIHSGVPMIGLPLFADQFNNIDTCVALNVARKLDYKKLTEEDMDDALRAVLNDPSYKQAALLLSAKFNDRPLSPIDTAAYWTEYIVKYGKNALRSRAMELTWWQVELLDVYALLLLAGAATLGVLVVVVRVLLNLFVTGTNVTRDKKTR